MISSTLDTGRPSLTIQLLGGFHAYQDGELLTDSISPRLQSFLAYLLLHRNSPQSRQHLAFLFWPDLPEDRAFNNFRQALHQLRKTIPGLGSFINADALHIRLRQDPAFQIDIALFEQELATAGVAERSGNLGALRMALERAASLYLGDLLPSCYDDWIFIERESLHQQCLSVYERMIFLLEGQRDYPAALQYAQRLIQLDRLHENGYRLLMRLYALNDDRANALRAYQACKMVLRQELGVEPETATREINERLAAAEETSASSQDIKQIPPLVGRQKDWNQILAAWSRAASGNPRVLLINGEAGVGKTRLGEELVRWAARQGINIAKTRAYAAEGRLSYDPIVDWLRSEACQKAVASLEKVWLTELSRLLPELHVGNHDLPSPEPLVEHGQRLKFFQAMAHGILSARQPLILVFDDLQWSDPETLEWLHYFLRAAGKARILLVATIRIEEAPFNQALQAFISDLNSKELVSEIQLTPLDAAETAQLAGWVVGEDLDENTAFRLFHETEGNPLFILETMRSELFTAKPSAETVTHFGPSPQPPHTSVERLPAKVRGVIVSRLGQLSPPARELAGMAAVIGRSFSSILLEAASGAREEDLSRWMDELWQRRLLREMGAGCYDFSHDKIREVAYSEISPPARPLLHRRVAQALKKIHASDLDPVSGQLASHFERAGMPEEAVSFYHRSAVVAQRVGANEEAILLLEKALELTQMLVEGLARDQVELDLQMALGGAIVIIRGYGSLETIRVYDRAKLLCQKLGRPLDPPILRALALTNVSRAEFKKALAFGGQLLEEARRQSSQFLEVEANYVLGVSLFWIGAVERSQDHLAEAIRQYQPQNAHSHILLYAQDPKPVCLCRLAFNQWCLGFPSQALDLSSQAMDYARDLAHPHSLGYAMFWDVLIYNHLNAFSAAEEKARALVDFAQEHRLAHWLPFGKVMLGWARAELGDFDAGKRLIQEGLEGSYATGTRYFRPFFESLLAEQFGKVGQGDAGMKILADSLAANEHNHEWWCEAELHRRLGSLLLQQTDPEGAERAFQRAVTSARNQRTKMFELRAAIQLARLWSGQGRKREAQHLLKPLYQWFHEGFDTPDLRSARELLENFHL